MKIIAFVAVVLASAGGTTAGDAGFESPFITGAGARALGMGGGFTAIANDASLVYYNPAGLASIQFSEISFMHMSLAEGTSYDFGAWTYPTTNLGGFAIGMMRVGTGDLIRRNNFENEGTFGYSNFQILASYGNNVARGFSFGATVKVVNQSLDTWSDYGFGLDLGSYLDIHKNVKAGLILRDLIPAELKLKSVKESVPASISAGLALVDLPLSDAFAITASFDIEKVETRDMVVHTGLELAVRDLYFLRSGYDRDNFSFGAGFRQNRFAFDYAYKMMDYIDDSHRFSVSFLLGSSVEDRERTREELVEEQSSRLLESEREKQLEFYTDKANEFYYQFRLDSALAYYQRALAFDENNQAIRGTIAAIEEAIRYQDKERARISEQETEMRTSIEKYYLQANNFYDKKYYLAAQDMLDLILDIQPDNAEANALSARIDSSINSEIAANMETARNAEEQADYLTAVVACTRILELDPENVAAMEAKKRLGAQMDLVQQLNRGIELYNAGDVSGARRRFRAVLAIDPANAVALDYVKKISAESAQSPTLEDLQRDKEIWQFYVDGLRFMRDDQYQKAIDSWNKVLKKYPTSMETLNNLEQARLRLKSEEAK